jgi:predicted protein tyrosine phosphatase
MFVGRHAVETCGPWSNWAVISIGEPNASDGDPKVADGWHAVLRLSFHDVTPDSHALDSGYTFMTDEDAARIVDFVRKVAPDVDGILVHCRAGISRSAAVAKWICGQYRIPFNRDYDKWNAHVYKLLCEAGPRPPKNELFGAMKSSVKHMGDIVSPLSEVGKVKHD